MVQKIIFFNGPPRSGKDTSADFLHDRLGDSVYQYKMALPLKEACHKLLGLQGSLTDLEPLKELPIKFIVCEEVIGNFVPSKLVKENGEMTLRQFYIHLSENVMKPMFGDDIFGRLAVEYLRQAPQPIATISDSGFAPEAMPIINSFGAENINLVRVHRPGKTFVNDSRGYVELPVHSLDLQNTGTLEDLEATLFSSLKSFIG